LVVERDGVYLPDFYISSPSEFAGHWEDAKLPAYVENPYHGISGRSGIVYHKKDI